MSMPTARLATFILFTLATSAPVSPDAERSPEVTVHEWGTFTSVAGPTGRAIDWLPLGGPTDLPCFVKHVSTTALIAKLGPGLQPSQWLNYETARTRLWGKVRMETPVIYFYAPDGYSGNVRVDFPRGVITEFYPAPTNNVTPFSTVTLTDPNQVHTVDWNVRVSPSIPDLYPNGGGESHYYAARGTDATPLKVGVETEKFIFYRGVASFDVPIQTKILANGEVEVWNILPEGVLPAVILFENRDGRMGFRSAGAVSQADTLAPPPLNASLDAMREALRKELLAAGLYPREAQAMLDTWRDSWFEEGARVFYVLPRRAVDAILPLHVNPAPTRTERVFVGRMELVDQRTMTAVKSALQSNDTERLERYGRFLHPISDAIISRGSDRATNDRIATAANAAFLKYTRQLRACE